MVSKILVISCDLNYTYMFDAGDRIEQRCLSQTNLCLVPGSTPYSKLQLHVGNGTNHRILLIGLLWGLPHGNAQEAPTSVDAKSQRKCSVNYSSYWYRWSSLSTYKLYIPQLSRTRIFISFVFMCSLDLQRRDAHCWSPAQERLPKWLLKAEKAVAYLPLKSLPVDSQLLQGKLQTWLWGSFGSVPDLLFTTSSAISWSRGSAIRKISTFFLNKDAWLLCNQCLADDRAIHERPSFY